MPAIEQHKGGARTGTPPAFGNAPSPGSSPTGELPHFLIRLPRRPILTTVSLLVWLCLAAGCAGSFPDLRSQEFSRFSGTVPAAGEHWEQIWQRDPGVSVDLPGDQFIRMAAGSPLPVLVEFYTSWCGFCSKFVPEFELIAQEYAGRVRCVTVDVERNRALSASMGVTVYPTFMLVKDGKVVDNWVGIGGGRQAVVRRLERLL